MFKGARRTLAATLALTAAGPAVALAAGPLHGHTYSTAVPSSGRRAENRRIIPLHAGGVMTLQVSRSGSTVTVHFSSSSPLLYCNTTKRLRVQSTRGARISSSGSFTASISERFNPSPGLPPIVQVITGRFSGHSVSGKIQTKAGECSGTTYFSAR
jgi:hypothetical protein